MEKRKDIIIEEGQAFFIGFIIAGGIAFLFWLAIGVNAQVLDLKSYTTLSTDSGGIKTEVILDPKLMTAAQLQDYSADLKKLSQDNSLLASKYAKLYDSCKNKR